MLHSDWYWEIDMNHAQWPLTTGWIQSRSEKQSCSSIELVLRCIYIFISFIKQQKEFIFFINTGAFPKVTAFPELRLAPIELSNYQETLNSRIKTLWKINWSWIIQSSIFQLLSIDHHKRYTYSPFLHAKDSTANSDTTTTQKWILFNTAKSADINTVRKP